jgi:deoxyadenosine/deoxycytidine kinase
MNTQKKIGIVGPCAAGKSTLIDGLIKLGFEAKHIAQEHSYAPAMWQKITQPDLLIYLDVSFETSMQRRKLNWTEEEFKEQIRRLKHAQEHAHFYIQTDAFTPGEVLDSVLRFLKEQNLYPSNTNKRG